MAMFSAVILAGGSASRMNGINKQLALLDGIPVVIRSALAFENSAQAGEIILAVPAGEEERYAALCSQYGITKLKAAVHGGATRFLSVKNALEYVSAGYAYIAIHDGARPLISTADIDRVLTDAVQYGSAIAAAPVTDTIKQVSGGSTPPRPRRRSAGSFTPPAWKSWGAAPRSSPTTAPCLSCAANRCT